MYPEDPENPPDPNRPGDRAEPTDLASRLRAAGVSEHVIGDELANLSRYTGSDLERAYAEALPNYLKRSTGSTNYRTVDSQSAMGNQLYGSGSGNRTNTPGGAWSGSGSGASGPSLPGLQFDDAYTKLLESIAQSQMGQVRSNPGLDSLMGFLTKQFQELSENPGYSPSERALLNTQAFEPIETNRQASAQRARERAAARGFAPSSGLMELDLRDIDRSADQARTVANRDLAIAGLDRRDRDLSQALNIGQTLGLDIPRGQRNEELALASLLYQLPRTAMQDALSVVSGTPNSTDAFSQALQLLQQQYSQQNRADYNNAALFSQIGQILAGLFR